jgi:hypothetical protein
LSARRFAAFSANAKRELALWFALHDGQDASSLGIGLDPRTNRTLHTLKSAVEAMRSIPKHSLVAPEPDFGPYLPLFRNEANDHVLYVARTGALVSWWRDGGVSDVVAESLLAWTEGAHAALRAALPELVARDRQRRRDEARAWDASMVALREIEPWAVWPIAPPHELRTSARLSAHRGAVAEALDGASRGTAIAITTAWPPRCVVFLKVANGWLSAQGSDRSDALRGVLAERDALPSEALLPWLADPSHTWVAKPRYERAQLDLGNRGSR